MVMSPNSQAVGFFVKILAVSLVCSVFRNRDFGNVFVNF